ncbi:hypothetical protein P8452_65857 [Trifolium repens]|nr:hypothetical protein P8452_65857 [Trifolium repens]
MQLEFLIHLFSRDKTKATRSSNTPSFSFNLAESAPPWPRFYSLQKTSSCMYQSMLKIINFDFSNLKEH